MTERYGVNYSESSGQGYRTGYDQSYGQSYRPGYGQSYDQGYRADHGQVYGQGYRPGYEQSYDQDYRADHGQGYGQGYRLDHDQSNGPGYEQGYGQDQGQNYGGQYDADEERNYEDSYKENYGEDHRQDLQEVSSFSKAGILKLGAAFMILVYVVLLLIYTSGSTKPFEEVAGSVEPLLNKESLVREDAQALKRYYGLNSADYEGVMFYSAEFSISAQEVLLIEVKTDQQVQEVRDAIEERLESRKNTFEGYAPEQAQLIREAQIQVRGRFLFLAVSPEAETLAAAFTKSL
nr:DUF4358 domain-containing protein [uncultured Schaedlerella sp.]